MLSKEILKKVKLIDIKSKYLATEVFAGEYESAFRGHGMEFEEVREYQLGDDIRSIDWNVTARIGHPYVKMFREERQLSVLFLVDASASEKFGTRQKFKNEVAAEVAALLAYAAVRSNDKVGLITFTDRIEKYIPPKKGSSHVWRVIKEILTFEPKGKKTDLQNALQFLAKVLHRRVICFLISDFFSPDFYPELGVASKKHDMISLVLRDPAEEEFPRLGWIQFYDPETESYRWVDTRQKTFQSYFQEMKNKQREKVLSQFLSLGVDYCYIDTNQDYVTPLLKLFRAREKKV